MNLNQKEVSGIMYTTDKNTEIVLPMINEVVEKYTQDLETVMRGIYLDVVNAEDPDINIIEKYFVKLSNTLYFVCSNTEYLAMYDGIAKAGYKEAYNNTLLSVNDNVDKASKKTVAEATAIAEADNIHEQVVSDIYNKAYKIVKAKIESAQTMVSTLSKVLSKRMSEQNLANSVRDTTPDENVFR